MPSAQPAMQLRSPYLRLMRLHQPTGIWLVFWPCIWAMALAAGDGHAGHLLLALVFLTGAVVMRGAGCIVNDMADREFDKHVERTKLRPLASGELTMRQAAGALFLLCLAGLGVLGIVLALAPAPLTLLTTALPVTALIVAYPFMKRITWWPQAFLGLTFNWGVLIAWVTLRGEVELPALWLYAACFFWTLAYDTIYGHQDKRDDERIGIKSTSRRLDKHRIWWVGGFYAGMALCYLAATQSAGRLDMAGVALIAAFAAWLLRRTDFDSPPDCHAAFRRNAWLGMGLAAWMVMGFSLKF